MTDIVDSKRRSELMTGIRSRNTTPELAVRRIAHKMGLRFRLHRKDLPGRPDLVFPKHRLTYDLRIVLRAFHDDRSMATYRRLWNINIQQQCTRTVVLP